MKQFDLFKTEEELFLEESEFYNRGKIFLKY